MNKKTKRPEWVKKLMRLPKGKRLLELARYEVVPGTRPKGWSLASSQRWEDYIAG